MVRSTTVGLIYTRIFIGLYTRIFISYTSDTRSIIVSIVDFINRNHKFYNQACPGLSIFYFVMSSNINKEFCL